MAVKCNVPAFSTFIYFVAIVVLGILVHTIYLYSIFDIYFTSPLVHGMAPHCSLLQPPAKRLALFVADGLRADKLFELENGSSRAPFIRSVITNIGRWGVSHTRVPTETRPGHAALIAGFYEDVSAVAKGWKDNPIEFDSVFNESLHTWSWGSPDILPMFAKGASGDHVWADMYNAEQEDFAAQDSSGLDTWVFEKVQEFFENANASLQEKLRAAQNVFFLHLLGLDTNGHAHRPFSKEYHQNIKIVDSGIKKIYELFEEYFDDNSTVYVMTSDHGMTSWGSHGAGHPHETLTPLVVWGAGIQKPEVVKTHEYNDGLSEQWGLSGVKRCDVSQADIAPLMSSLIGIPFPMNSVGVLPLDYLHNTGQYKAENIFTNAKQILAQYQIIEQMRKETSLVFQPFAELTGSMQMAFIRDITIALKSEDNKKAENLSHCLIKLSLKGMKYYQKYDNFFLCCAVTLGFLSWIGSVTLQVLTERGTNPKKSGNQPWNSCINKIFVVVGCTALIMLQINKAPITHYLYCVLPLVCLKYIIQRRTRFKIFFPKSFSHALKFLLRLSISTICIEVLVLSFFYRYTLIIGLIFIAIWPLTTLLVNTHPGIFGLWALNCLTLACFLLLPVVGRESNYPLVTLAGMFGLIGGMVVLFLHKKNKGAVYSRERVVFGVQFFILVAATAVLTHTTYNLSLKRGLPIVNQMFSWATVICSIFLPIFITSALVLRLLSTGISLLSVYVLLSSSYEGLFVVVLSSTMALWLILEHHLFSCRHEYLNASPRSLSQIHFHDPHDIHTRQVSFDNLRRAFFFVFFIIIAFFGAGNIASINTFDPTSVYCFLTVFSPFVMGFLLILKVVIPFTIVMCIFDAIHVVCKIAVHQLFLLALVIFDFMALRFFFLVQDNGSWLEIGTSLNHYVIVFSFIIYLFFIFAVARHLTRNTWWTLDSRKQHTR